MESHKNGNTGASTLNPSPHTEVQILTSKFLRKARFRRHSTDSDLKDRHLHQDSETRSVNLETQEGSMSLDNQSYGISSTPTASPNIAPKPNVTSVTLEAGLRTSICHPSISAQDKMTYQVSLASPPSTSPESSIASSRPSSPNASLDVTSPIAEHPTFPLSQKELDQAKFLVLDLLGWGVDPEYLVTTGISPLVVFRVFTDLNLRLPKNLELSEESKSIAYPWGQPAEQNDTLVLHQG